MALIAVALVNQGRKVAVLIRMSRMILIEADPEISKIGDVLIGNPGDQLLRRDALGTRFEHNRGAMSVVGADIPAIVPAHFLKARKNVGLYIFHQMADMDRPIGVGQRAGDQNIAAPAIGGFQELTHNADSS